MQIEAYGIPNDDDYTVLILNSVQRDVIADAMEALIHGNPTDFTAIAIWEALR